MAEIIRQVGNFFEPGLLNLFAVQKKEKGIFALFYKTKPQLNIGAGESSFTDYFFIIAANPVFKNIIE